jgi:hypothetical protein
MIWRVLWPLLLASFLALVSANFFMGLPGAFFMDALLDGRETAKLGPGAWALAIYVSFLAPFGVAPAIWAMMRLRPAAAWWQWAGAGLAGYLLAGAIATYNVA